MAWRERARENFNPTPNKTISVIRRLFFKSRWTLLLSLRGQTRRIINIHATCYPIIANQHSTDVFDFIFYLLPAFLFARLIELFFENMRIVRNISRRSFGILRATTAFFNFIFRCEVLYQNCQRIIGCVIKIASLYGYAGVLNHRTSNNFVSDVTSIVQYFFYRQNVQNRSNNLFDAVTSRVFGKQLYLWICRDSYKTYKFVFF